MLWDAISYSWGARAVNTVVRAIIFIIILGAIAAGIIYVYTPLPAEKADAPAPAAVEAPAPAPAAEPAPAPAAEPAPAPAAEPAPAPAAPAP